MNYLGFFSDVMALFLLWLFLRAGLHKLLPDSSGYFKKLLSDYGVSNPVVSSGLRFGLGLVEVCIAIGIVFTASRHIAAVAAILMLLAYLIGMATQLLKGRADLNCGCAGPGAQIKVAPVLLLRNALLLVLTSTCLVSGVDMSGGVWFVILMTSLVLIVSYSGIERLIENDQIIKLLRV